MTLAGPKKISRDPRTEATAHGRKAVMIGMGGLGIAALLGFISTKVEAEDGRLFASLFALFWLFAAVSFLKKGRADIAEAARIDRRKNMAPDQPWYWDHRWDSGGISEGVAQSLKGMTRKLAVLSVVFGSFSWFVFYSSRMENAPDLFRMITVGIDLVLIGFWCHLGYRTLRYFKYGDSRLNFETFPFFLDEILRVSLVLPRAMQASQLEIRLLAIEERYEWRNVNGKRKVVVECYQHYEHAQKVAVEAGAVELPIELPLPAAPETRLSLVPPFYWVLAVSAETPGIDYSAEFLLPIYGKNNIDRQWRTSASLDKLNL